MCPNAPQASRLSAKGPTSGGRIPLGALGARTTPTRAGFLQKDRPVAVESHWGLGVPEQPPREPAFGRRTDQWRSMPTGGWGCPNNPHTRQFSAGGPFQKHPPWKSLRGGNQGGWRVGVTSPACPVIPSQAGGTQGAWADQRPAPSLGNPSER